MNLLTMSFSAAIMIIVIIILRALLLYKLPKKVFLILWSLALLRLLVPVSFPSRFSIYFLISQNPLIMDKMVDIPIANFLPIDSGTGKEEFNRLEEQSIKRSAEDADADMRQDKEQEPGTQNQIVQEKENTGQKEVEDNASAPVKEHFPVWTVVWLMGMSVCIIFFTVTYYLCCRQFRTSLPVENEIVKEWLSSHKIKRKLSVRQSDCISAPLTYGFFHPVILMPKTTKWENSRQLQFILEHEFVHIQRLDVIVKLFFMVAVCVHWFNPLVWVMYMFVNRDIELSCDEKVILRFGQAAKSAYALTLIHMEEMKNSLVPLGSHFSRNAAEERITAIMKLKKSSVSVDTLVSILLIIVTTGFATYTFDEQGVDSVEEAEDSLVQNTAFLDEDKNKLPLTNLQNNLGFPGAMLQKENHPEAVLDEMDVQSQTKLSTGQQKELFEEYQKYGVYKNNGIFYYQGRSIRCLIDKYEEITINDTGGMNFNTIRVYSYFNEKGEVDLNVIRESQFGKTEVTEIYRDVMGIRGTSVGLYRLIMDLPQESVNRLARKAAREGRYGDLKKIVPFADQDILDEITPNIMY